MGDIVTEGGSHGIVVRPAPLSKDVFQPEDNCLPAPAAGPSLHGLLRLAFTDPIGIIQSGLNR